MDFYLLLPKANNYLGFPFMYYKMEIPKLKVQVKNHEAVSNKSISATYDVGEKMGLDHKDLYG